MSDTVKLYKCYKGTCSRCLSEDNPFITEDEYTDFLDIDGKLQCPEGHLDCGIQELKPEDFPKPPTDNKKKIVIAASIVGLLVLLGIGGYVYYSFSKTSETVKEVKTTANATLESSSDKEEVITNNNIKEESLSEDASNSSAPSVPASNAKSNEATIDATPTQVKATTLEDHLTKLADKDIPYDNKKGLKLSFQSFFTPDAKIVQVNNNGNAMDNGKSVGLFAEHLNATGRAVIIKDKVMSGNKISILKIQEE